VESCTLTVAPRAGRRLLLLAAVEMRDGTRALWSHVLTTIKIDVNSACFESWSVFPVSRNAYGTMESCHRWARSATPMTTP
jgi:hypothetical protein